MVEPGGLYIIEDVECYWHDHWASNVDGPAWLAQFIATVNLSGRSFFGWPSSEYGEPPVVELSELERTLEFVHFYKGLVIFGKAA